MSVVCGRGVIYATKLSLLLMRKRLVMLVSEDNYRHFSCFHPNNSRNKLGKLFSFFMEYLSKEYSDK